MAMNILRGMITLIQYQFTHPIPVKITPVHNMHEGVCLCVCVCVCVRACVHVFSVCVC